MARFVLLYFKDDKRAEEYVGVSLFTGARVVGIYQDPRHEPCKCVGDHDWTKYPRMWKHHSKYGWPLHAVCGRIHKLHRACYGMRMFQVFGRNLLPENETPKSLRNPEGFK